MTRKFQEHWYILDADDNVVPADDVLTWAHWLENNHNQRNIDWTGITSEPDCWVSTVFIGLDHRYYGDGPPLLFETLVFGGPLNGEMWRYSSYDDAETGHKVAVRKARAAAGQKITSPPLASDADERSE